MHKERCSSLPVKLAGTGGTPAQLLPPGGQTQQLRPVTTVSNIAEIETIWSVVSKKQLSLNFPP